METNKALTYRTGEITLDLMPNSMTSVKLVMFIPEAERLVRDLQKLIELAKRS